MADSTAKKLESPSAQAGGTAAVSSKVANRKKLGEMLVEKQLLRAGELSAAVKRAEHDKIPLGTYLVSEGLISDVDMARVLAEQLEMEYEDLSRKVVSADVLKSMRPDVIREYSILPFA
ncbi:MAG: hypothetical protein EBZ67_01405, partial [Chitinophagia bacterium]|nr:hypothetical protein [Chitinophagia bacterium]